MLLPFDSEDAGPQPAIVAAGLTDDPTIRVLLLEAGPAAEEHPETLVAAGYKEAFINDAVMGERFSVPQAHSAKQRVFAGTGTVMGGSGSVNGMVYTRGAREDYAEWPRGWNWGDIERDFEAIEKRLRPHRRPATEWVNGHGHEVGHAHLAPIDCGGRPLGSADPRKAQQPGHLGGWLARPRHLGSSPPGQDHPLCGWRSGNAHFLAHRCHS